MDIEALKTFLEVNRTRHFGKAAENLYLSQSAVSARIRMLEENVGVPLFSRQRNNIHLTAAGEHLLQYAESILTTWNRARQQIGVSDAGKRPLMVGLMPSLWDICLHEWSAHVYRQHRELVLQMEILEGDVMTRRLLEGTLDLAFSFEPAQSVQIVTKEIVQMPLILVSSREGVSVDEALGDDYILVDWGSSFGAAHARLFPQVSPRIRLPLGRMARDLMLSHGGSAYLSEPMVRAEIAAGNLFPVREAPRIDRQAYASFVENKEERALVAQVLEYFETGTSGGRTV